MKVLTAEITLYLPWVQSLKDKRSVVSSLTKKLSGKYHLSAAEVGHQDVHQTAVIGIAQIVSDAAMADAVLENVIRFVEANCEGEITGVVQELR